MGNVTFWTFISWKYFLCPKTIICDNSEQIDTLGDILNAVDNIEDQKYYGFTGLCFKIAHTIYDNTTKKLMKMKLEHLRSQINIKNIDKQSDERNGISMTDEKVLDKNKSYRWKWSIQMCDNFEQIDMLGDILNAVDNIEDQKYYGFTGLCFKIAHTIYDNTTKKLMKMKLEHLRSQINIKNIDKQSDERNGISMTDEKVLDKNKSYRWKWSIQMNWWYKSFESGNVVFQKRDKKYWKKPD